MRQVASKASRVQGALVEHVDAPARCRPKPQRALAHGDARGSRRGRARRTRSTAKPPSASRAGSTRAAPGRSSHARTSIGTISSTAGAGPDANHGSLVHQLARAVIDSGVPAGEPRANRAEERTVKRARALGRVEVDLHARHARQPRGFGEDLRDARDRRLARAERMPAHPLDADHGLERHGVGRRSGLWRGRSRHGAVLVAIDHGLEEKGYADVSGVPSRKRRSSGRSHAQSMSDGAPWPARAGARGAGSRPKSVPNSPSTRALRTMFEERSPPGSHSARCRAGTGTGLEAPCTLRGRERRRPRLGAAGPRSLARGRRPRVARSRGLSGDAPRRSARAARMPGVELADPAFVAFLAARIPAADDADEAFAALAAHAPDLYLAAAVLSGHARAIRASSRSRTSPPSPST